MRVSVTDRCNLRCVYCMPEEGVRQIVHKEILSYEEIARIIRIASGMGVRKVRITGGEPLARKNIQSLIKDISNIKMIEDLSLTTNGVLLERYADELRGCGLDRINVSLDTLRPERYREITRGGDFDSVMRGIEKARSAGLDPVKINMVPIRGLNDDEICDFAELTRTSPLHVRFIEFMPIGNGSLYDTKRHIPTRDIKKTVEKLGDLAAVRLRKNGPAKYYRLHGAEGVIGFISAMTHHFCRECNRLRLTADGKLRPCLFSETEIDLKTPMRRGITDGEIERLLKLSIEVKPEGHYLLERAGERRPMSRIGG
jgi:cyclic pyranopterin phosphate synthase